MAQFRSLRDLLPATLVKLSEEGCQARGLAPLWAEIVGPGLAAHSTPAQLSAGCLVVKVTEPRWATVLEGQSALLLGRLAAVLGPGKVHRLVFKP